MSACTVCGHPMVVHDGDGQPTDPYVCTQPGCRCAYEVGVGGRPEMIAHPDY